MLKKGFPLLLLSLLPMSGQTLVNLRTQTQAVDFTTAASTRPVKAGTVLPPTCGVGELFFKTNASAGANLYACVAANTWVVETGGSSGGTLLVQDSGVTVGERGTLNFVPGVALLNVTTDTGTRINVQHNLDTAVAQTLEGEQSGAARACASSSGSTANYTCQLMPTLTQFYPNMVLHWKPDVTAVGGTTTLNIDTLGSKSIKLADGATDPAAGDIQAGRLYDIWYDGTVFRMQTPPVLMGSTETRPVCEVALRGRLWHTFEGTGVKDEVAVCAKTAADTYGWQTLY